MSSERAELVQQVQAGGRALSTATVMLHTAIAEASGLTAVESKTCDYLDRFGPLTPKELARHCGLAPASVTALIDRLERKGRVRRVPHPADGRRLLVELDQVNAQATGSLFAGIAEGTRKLCERFDEAQLRTVVEFLEEAAEVTHQAAVEVTDGAT